MNKENQLKITENLPQKTFFKPLFVSISLFLAIGTGSAYYISHPNQPVSQEKTNTVDTLQNAHTWLAPFVESQKFKLQEIPKEFRNLKEFLQILSYRMDSYFNDPQANKKMLLQDIQETIIKNIDKESQYTIEQHLTLLKLNLNLTPEELQSHDTCTYACIVYKKAIPMLQDFFQQKK